ncbi:MAG: hypothetical protein ACD_54C00455G0001 [uncultured bacterium]|nr:MAG: hypothetical protein ACD_54C00455G0001 [uncultured bacterium]
MRRRLFEHVHPIPQHAPILPGGMDLRLALDQNQNDLTIPGDFGGSFPGLQPIEPKADIAPARIFRRDVMHLAGGSVRFAQQIGHSLLPDTGSGGRAPQPFASYLSNPARLAKAFRLRKPSD